MFFFIYYTVSCYYSCPCRTRWSFSVCQSSHGVCKHEGWIRAIRKMCKTLTGACIHVPYLTCKSKATKKKKHIKNRKKLKGFHSPAPPTLTHEKCAQPQPHSDTNCAHYAVFLTHTSIPLHSLSSRLPFCAKLPVRLSSSPILTLCGSTMASVWRDWLQSHH